MPKTTDPLPPPVFLVFSRCRQVHCAQGGATPSWSWPGTAAGERCSSSPPRPATPHEGSSYTCVKNRRLFGQTKCALLPANRVHLLEHYPCPALPCLGFHTTSQYGSLSPFPPSKQACSYNMKNYYVRYLLKCVAVGDVSREVAGQGG